MQTEQTIHTSVQKVLLKKKLMIGSIFSISGALMITSIGSFGSVVFLDHWGFSVIFLGFALIAWGLIPYRKLSRLSGSPNALKISKNGISYIDRNRAMFFIPFISIKNIRFIKRKDRYGIGIDLEKGLKKKIQILDPRFKPRTFLIYSQKWAQTDLYLPYFPEKACKELDEILRETK